MYYGYWQSEQYFASIAPAVREAFRFVEPSSSTARGYYEEIRQAQAVSIHVRRGDYLGMDSYRDVFADGYYERAIAYVKSKVNNPRFYVFSDDTAWCRSAFAGEQFHMVEHEGKDVHVDMWLMSNCKHNIIANSTYSWWGAWLNANPEKIVVSPKEWFTERSVFLADMDDLLPGGWVRL
jgi:hypothetical protein